MEDHPIESSPALGDLSSDAIALFSSIMDTSNQKMWDFSITSACTISLGVAYIAQCVRLKNMPPESRNKLTMTIWWSLFFNLLAY